MAHTTLPSASAGVAAGIAAARRRLPLLVMLSGTLLVVLDFFIVNVALPAIQQDLHASSSALQWIVAGYGLATAAGLITGGRLGDLFGRPRAFKAGLLLFTLASVACGFAPDAATLVAARIAQGAAGAILQPQVLAMMSITYAGAARARAFAAYGLTLGLGATLGQLLGGALLVADWGGLGWRSCFLINLPFGLAALALAPRALAGIADTRTKSRIDVVGVLLAAGVAVAVVWPLVEGRAAGWPAWTFLVLAGAFVLLGVLLQQQAARERSGRDPLLPSSLLADRRFRAGLATGLVFYAGNASLYFVLALHLQQTLRLSPLQSGVVFSALALGFFLTSMAAPQLAKRFGGAPIARGALLLACAHLLQWVNAQGLPAGFLTLGVPLLLLQGAGLGMVMAPLSSAVLARVAPQHSGVASGLLATVQHAGNALGVALVGALYFRSTDHGDFAASLAYLAVTALLTAACYRAVLRD
jgi:EmrB/QacA subfamily drug resistance transporter